MVLCSGGNVSGGGDRVLVLKVVEAAAVVA